MSESLEHESVATNRRSFLLQSAAVGAGAIGASLLTEQSARAMANTGSLSSGDAAILRFLAALEILETDLWQQYNELAGIQDSEVPGGSGNPAYAAAVAVLDSDMAQYIHDNTVDEFTHFTFLNAYLEAKGERPANLDQFKRSEERRVGKESRSRRAPK